MLAQCWDSVTDGDPTLNQHEINVSCLVGSEDNDDPRAPRLWIPQIVISAGNSHTLPANTRHRRRRASIDPTLFQCLVFAGPVETDVLTHGRTRVRILNSLIQIAEI